MFLLPPSSAYRFQWTAVWTVGTHLHLSAMQFGTPRLKKTQIYSPKNFLRHGSFLGRAIVIVMEDPTPLAGMRTWWMVGALGPYADQPYLFSDTSVFFNVISTLTPTYTVPFCQNGNPQLKYQDHKILPKLSKNAEGSIYGCVVIGLNSN